jgi:hypothetical protein
MTMIIPKNLLISGIRSDPDYICTYKIQYSLFEKFKQVRFLLIKKFAENMNGITLIRGRKP